MAADLEYFRLCRKTDPSYTVENAIMEYLSGDFDEAMEVANQICDLNDDYDSRVLTYDDVMDIIENMNPVDAFWDGRYSSCDINTSGYYYIDGYGHFEAADGDHVMNIISDGWEHIVNGECDISDDLQDVIDVFEDDDDEDDDDYRSNNRKSATKKKPASKAGAKKPAKSQCVKRTGTSKTKTPAKKPAQSNNRKPRTTSGKAPAKKAPARRR